MTTTTTTTTREQGSRRLDRLLDAVPRPERARLLCRVLRLWSLGWTCLGLMGADEDGVARVGDLCGLPPGEKGVRFYEDVFGKEEAR